MRIIQGQKIAKKILVDLKRKIKTKKITPQLVVILVGQNPASRLYVSFKERTAKQVGIKVKKYHYSNRISEKKVLELIKSLNQDPGINGILVQMPLPKHLRADKIIKAINPEKDVDGFLPRSKFKSPFILAIWQVLKATKENLKNKKIVALVNSDVFGRALGRFLREKGLRISYVKPVRTSEKSRTKHCFLSDSSLRMIKTADILISACGRPNFIKESMLKEGVILIDGGVTKKGKKIVGDIDVKSVKEKARWLSPVPGGVGPITVALLLKNVFLASQIQP
jgi:methylenetetrahydrofolate dehydrogenase (NADP+)/methenyltetrahydrofolate cyclohydrolase